MDTMSQKELSEAIRNINFTIIDLNLYLDTHPDDNRALMMFNQAVMQCRMLKDMYECQYAPLTNASPSAYPYQWINNPWPWDYCSNV